jgi:hypothetical protein
LCHGQLVSNDAKDSIIPQHISAGTHQVKLFAFADGTEYESKPFTIEMPRVEPL